MSRRPTAARSRWSGQTPRPGFRERSKVRIRLALRPTIPAEARSTPTERPTRRGSALTANGIDCGASSSRGRFVPPRDALELLAAEVDLAIVREPAERLVQGVE